jgi:predicted 3-demethylubiquinone-9 3-methyltransferase (glyoxalase superfamily)
MQQIVPNLWFDTQAEEAANYYVSVFEDGRVVNVTHYPANSDKAGQVLTAEWEVRGMRFVGINGGPLFTFSEAVSFSITCEDQEEIDHYWDKLTDGGEEAPCGWCKDRYGLSWQVVPKGMDELFADPDTSKVERAWEAMMKMKKIDVAELRRAAEGVPAA